VPVTVPAPVASVPSRPASVLSGGTAVTALENRLSEMLAAGTVDAQARAAAARALAAISPDKHVKRLGAIAADPQVPPALRDAVAQSLGELNTEAGREAKRAIPARSAEEGGS